jgi:hypothetical protein
MPLDAGPRDEFTRLRRTRRERDAARHPGVNWSGWLVDALALWRWPADSGRVAPQRQDQEA